MKIARWRKVCAMASTKTTPTNNTSFRIRLTIPPKRGREGGRGACRQTDGWEAQKATGKACTGTAAATTITTQRRTDDNDQLYAWWWWCFLVVRAAATALRPVLIRRPRLAHTHTPPSPPPSLHFLPAGGEGKRGTETCLFFLVDSSQ